MKLKVFAIKVLAERINDSDGINIYSRATGMRARMVETAGPASRDAGQRIVSRSVAVASFSEVVSFSGN